MQRKRLKKERRKKERKGEETERKLRNRDYGKEKKERRPTLVTHVVNFVKDDPAHFTHNLKNVSS